MKIALLASHPYSLVSFRGPLITEMIAAGNEVIGLGPHDDQRTIEGLAQLGAVYRSVHLSRTSLNPLEDLGSILTLVRVLRELSPDILLSYTIKPVIYGSIAAKKADISRSFSMIEGLGYAFMGNGIRNNLLKQAVIRLYRHALTSNSKVFFLNPEDRNLFKELKILKKPEQAVLLNGIGIDLEHFPETAPKEEPICFLLIARLISDKGIREFAGAARILKRKYPSLRFKLLGPLDTNPAALSKEEIDGWSRDKIVEYLGETDDVRPIIAGSSVFVLPSYYREGLPRTLMEAMAMGRPLVTTDKPGCRETVKDGVNGFLIPARDVDALAEALERFVKEPSLIASMGEHSRSLAEERFDVRSVNRVIMKIMGLSSPKAFAN